MPKFKWGVSLIMECQKTVLLDIEANTLGEAYAKIFELFDNNYSDSLNKERFKKAFPDISLEYDEFDKEFESVWSECNIFGFDHLTPIDN